MDLFQTPKGVKTMIIPTKAAEVKKEIKKFKLKCFKCKELSTSFYQGKSFCQLHYPRKIKESKYKTRAWWNQ